MVVVAATNSKAVRYTTDCEEAHVRIAAKNNFCRSFSRILVRLAHRTSHSAEGPGRRYPSAALRILCSFLHLLDNPSHRHHLYAMLAAVRRCSTQVNGLISIRNGAHLSSHGE